MHCDNLHLGQHAHAFGQDQKLPGELRTIVVIAITGAMMVAEVAAGIIFGSMALLADGLHMASHAAALSINAFVYIYARRHAHDTRYSFGTGKLNALGGFTGAILLAIFALMMTGESIKRIVYPIHIAFNQAIFVAFLGLIVNGISMLMLRRRHDHHHPNENASDRHVGHYEDQLNHHHDYNLRSAYLHVLADAVTSFLAIFALFAAKYLGLIWMDPLMGILGAVLVSRWSLGLLRDSSAVLLDKQGPKDIQSKIIQSIENDDNNKVADLHLWSIGPNIYGVIISVVAHDPKPPAYYKELIPSGLGLLHVTVEVNRYFDKAGLEREIRTEPHSG